MAPPVLSKKPHQVHFFEQRKGSGLPDETQGYHSLVTLGKTSSLGAEKRKFASWPSTVYKAVNSQDSHTYALRRVEGIAHFARNKRDDQCFPKDTDLCIRHLLASSKLGRTSDIQLLFLSARHLQLAPLVTTVSLDHIYCFTFD
jgi:hypothetical protein